MLRDRDPGDETAHVPDFHFYTGAPVPRLRPATVDDREADYGSPTPRLIVDAVLRAQAQAQQDHSTFAAEEPVSLDADEDDHEIYVLDVSDHFAPGSLVYRIGYATRRERDALVDGVTFHGPWGAFAA